MHGGLVKENMACCIATALTITHCWGLTSGTMLAVDQRYISSQCCESSWLPCVQAARAASSAAVAAQQQSQPQEAREPLPAFGSGIAFRPTKKVKQQASSQAFQKSAAVSNPNDELDADDGMDDADMQPVSQHMMVGL